MNDVDRLAPYRSSHGSIWTVDDSSTGNDLIFLTSPS